MTAITFEENWSYKNQKVCCICKKRFKPSDDNDNKKYHKVRDHCQFTGKCRGAAHSNCSINYKISKKHSVVFHNGSTYDYHFIIKKLANEFEVQFE